MKLSLMLLPRVLVAAVVGWLPVMGQEAEPAHPEKPLLWKVEAPGQAEPSYLFGTMHLGDKAVVTLHPAAEKAFRAATALHTEAAMDPATQMGATKAMTRNDGKTLDEAIGEDLAKRLETELKVLNPELDAEPFQHFQTWMVAYSLPFLEEHLAGRKSLDLVLWERAEKEGKKTAGMQAPKDQVAGFTELSDEEQIHFLTCSLDYMRRNRHEGRDPIKEAVAMYVTGDIEKISALAMDWMAELTDGKDGPLMAILTKRILRERDEIMANYIDATLKQSPEEMHFFAAGAGHYAAGGVPEKLVEKGYKLTRIAK